MALRKSRGFIGGFDIFTFTYGRFLELQKKERENEEARGEAKQNKKKRQKGERNAREENFRRAIDRDSRNIKRAQRAQRAARPACKAKEDTLLFPPARKLFPPVPG